MRLFVALRPPAPALDDLAAALARLPQRVAGEPPRWQPPERWHVTLAFLGEVDEAALPRLTRRLEQSARRHDPIGPLRLAGAGRFGRSVLWMGVGAGAPAGPGPGDAVLLRLRRLAESIQAGLRREGVQIERRPWRAHLTLARLRQGDRAPAPWVAALAGYAGPSWVATEVLLVRSVLGPQAAYVDLARVPLGRGDAGGAAPAR